MLGKKDIRLIMNWWKSFQEKEEIVESIEPEDENKEHNIQFSEDEKELEEVDKEIKELQVGIKNYKYYP